jgi:hypothetical protein
MKAIKHLVMFSGGICSWATAKRVVERHGKDGVTLLFADTKMEDEDLYRFLDEAAANVGVPLVKIADGRTPWEVMKKERMIGNSRIDPCSKILKRNLLNRWVADHCAPDETVVHVGLLWDEQFRLTKLQARTKPWRYEAVMTEKPWVSKDDMFRLLKLEGIEPPRLYAMGFAHNNCGGFCVKAGQAHFANLLRVMPERYAFHEAKEEEMRTLVGDHSIMKDPRNGKKVPLTLREFRLRIEAGKEYDLFDLGGCGCAIE